MVGARSVVLGMIMVGLAACGSGGSSADAGGNPGGSGGGSGGGGGSSVAMGTFTAQSGSPCVTGNIKGFDPSVPSKNDPQCTVVENPGDGGSPVTFVSCIDNNLQPPCWGPVTCGNFLGLQFTLNYATPPPANATYSYQCIICPPGESC